MWRNLGAKNGEAAVDGQRRRYVDVYRSCFSLPVSQIGLNYGTQYILKFPEILDRKITIVNAFYQNKTTQM
jgi:hypothetical protein